MYAGVPSDVPTPVMVGADAADALLLARCRDRLRDAEVGDDGRARGEQHVVGLDVAVDDAAAVREGERADDVLEDRDRFADGERAAHHARAQRLAVDERHDEVRQRAELTGAQARARCSGAAAPRPA